MIWYFNKNILIKLINNFWFMRLLLVKLQQQEVFLVNLFTECIFNQLLKKIGMVALRELVKLKLPPNPSGTYVLRMMLQKMVGKVRGLLPSFRREMCLKPACRPSRGRILWPISLLLSSYTAILSTARSGRITFGLVESILFTVCVCVWVHEEFQW